jgi:F5/8 type C domain
MVFNLRHIFHRATAVSEPNIASDEDLPFFEKSEENKDVLGYAPSPPSKFWIKHKKLQFGVKVLFLTSVFAFTLFFGRAIFNYATLGYHAILRSIEAHGDVACSHNVTVNEPISIAAPPWKGPPVGAFETKDRSKWVAECSNSSDALHDCKYAISGSDSYWQSPDTAPSGGHWILIDLNQTYNVHSVAVRSHEDWKKQGGAVQKHRVEVATVKGNWELVASGAWRGDTGDRRHLFSLLTFVNIEGADNYYRKVRHV